MKANIFFIITVRNVTKQKKLTSRSWLFHVIPLTNTAWHYCFVLKFNIQIFYILRNETLITLDRWSKVYFLCLWNSEIVGFYSLEGRIGQNVGCSSSPLEYFFEKSCVCYSRVFISRYIMGFSVKQRVHRPGRVQGACPPSVEMLPLIKMSQKHYCFFGFSL